MEVVLPCKPGDDYWWVSSETLEINHEEGGITGVVVYKDHFKIVDKLGDLCDIGTQWCCLTREEAEAFRAKMMQHES